MKMQYSTHSNGLRLVRHTLVACTVSLWFLISKFNFGTGRLGLMRLVKLCTRYQLSVVSASVRRQVAAGSAAHVLRAAARDLQRRGRADGAARARAAADAGREHDAGGAARAARSVLHVHHDARRSRAAQDDAHE